MALTTSITLNVTTTDLADLIAAVRNTDTSGAFTSLTDAQAVKQYIVTSLTNLVKNYRVSAAQQAAAGTVVPPVIN